MATKTDPGKTDPPEQTTTDGDNGDKPEAKSIDARFKAIEAEQANQGSKLDKILELLPGSTSSKDDGDGDGDDEPSGPAQRHNIGAEVRRQIAESEQRRKAEEREAGLDTWRKGVDEQLEKLKPEKPPRAPQSRLQRIMYGRDE